MITQQNIFNFHNTYQELPAIFYSRVNPSPVPNAQKLLINENFIKDLNLDSEANEDLVQILAGNVIPANASPIAQAYAGHQFGHFTMLGDGRAILLGEHLTNENKRFDIQLKGGGQTPYSRRGDGKATLKAMLREYLISEAMHYLNIPTSRSLAVIKTGEPVYRNFAEQGAVLTRVMSSHIRVGTFEYARNYGTTEDIQRLTDYTINRHFPELKGSKNPALSLLEKAMNLQIELVTNWMRVGFIHGVMNTDNTSIAGETFDYGPCAFINTYHPGAVFSSIDTNGRYAFGNQPAIILWNISRLAEALLPVIHEDTQTAVKSALTIIEQFDALWKKSYYEMMLNKTGIENKNPENYLLIDELLEWMQVNEADYTNTFSALSLEIDFTDNPLHNPSFKQWMEKWKKAVSENNGGFEKARSLMKVNNPVFIPRNHLVEKALADAQNGDLSFFERLLNVLKTPAAYNENYHSWLMPPDLEFDKNYQTFCGT
jgi:serine/tyrosine/threonine adenylyltransferase